MLHPVGDLAPSVYWRRRLVLLAALLLVGLTLVIALESSKSSHPGAGPGSASVGESSALPPSSSSSPVASSSQPTTPASSSQAAPVACVASQLSIAAATDRPSYAVGNRPNLAIVVTNKGQAPCVQDLADRQIELRVFAGSARVWGSHDCQIEPGTSPQMLPSGQPIRRVIQWSGLSSQVGCAGVRQQVPAGTYTLHALLAGHEGTPVTFTFTG